MTQQVIHCRVKLKSTDPEVDDPSFGFTFEATGSDAGFTFDDTSPVAALLHLLDGGATTYTNNTGFVPAITSFMGHYLSPVLSRLAGDAVVVTTDITAHLDGSAAGPPLRSDVTALVIASSSQGLPEGVTAGMSWRAPYGSATEFAPGARPRSRYRNRCYFGPLALSDSHTGTDGSTRLDTTFQADLEAYLTVLSTNNTTVGHTAQQWDLVAWSRKDAAVRDAEFGAVSERFDYQRRRTERISNESWFAIS